jgi:3-methyladenine DNA glycosylase/8-oxoguanine DNA glycosylase
VTSQKTLAFSVDEALAHLRSVDPVLRELIDAVPYDLQLRTDPPFASLLRTILFQQLAGAAANAIQRRLLALHEPAGQMPAPEQILATTDEEFRSAGVSRQKAAYMRDLALKATDGTLDFEHFPDMSDEEVIKRITAVHGLGEWSAHMYLMFHLGRPDVLPIGDLGVRNGMKIAYGLEATPTPKEAKEIGARWAPYRSVGSWYMWRAAIDRGGATAPDM